jgi:hypothetical protein
MPETYCKVWDAGTSSADGEVYIVLEASAGEFPARWFKADPQHRKEFLAAALTAMSAGLRVLAEIEDWNQENSRIIRLFATRR